MNQVLAITEKYIEDNPNKSASAIRELRSLYLIGSPSPLELSHEIDAFFSHVENREKPLALAISAARANLKLRSK